MIELITITLNSLSCYQKRCLARGVESGKMNCIGAKVAACVVKYAVEHCGIRAATVFDFGKLTHTVLQTHIALVPAEEAWGSFRNIRELKTNKINNHSQLLSKPQKVGVMPGPSRTSWSLPMTRPRSGARPCFATSGLCRVIRTDGEQMKH